MSIKKYKYILLMMVVFGIIYSLISIVNHYNFRTHALDLGVYTNALYDYIHFQINDSTIFKETTENLLSDHFNLHLILFSPLSLIFKTYTLLLIQLFFILLGGLGIYKYFALTKNTNLALTAALYFYIFFGVFSALSFDYHNIVIAASLVPWFFYFLKQKKLLATSIMLLLILTSKESVSLWLAFICLGLIVEYRKELFWRNYLIISFIICISYFAVITSIVMPALSNNGTYTHFNYSHLGSNSFEAVLFLIKHPFESFKMLFINHVNNPLGDYVKAELHILILMAGLPLLIKKPQYILMLIPIYFQKLFNDNYIMWSIDGHYSIEYAPILTIGVFSVISELKNEKLKKIIPILVVITTLGCTIRVMDNTILFTDKSKIRIYKEAHYSRDYNVKEVHEQLSKIPKDVVVSAQSPFLPHLSLRNNIYQFPIIKDAEYVIYSKKENLYPLNQKTFNTLTSEIENSDDWKIEFQNDHLTILKKSSDN